MINNSIIYNRISSTNQSNIKNYHISLENQYDHCKNYCDQNGLNIINTVNEIKSARNMNNQNNLYNIINNYNDINIIIYNITRFSRNVLQGLQILKKLEQKNIIIHFVEENAKTNCYLDKHRIRLGLSQSEYESDTISNRIKSNNNVLKKKGWKFGKPEYGKEIYFNNGVRQTKINKYEKNIIDFIVAARISSCTVNHLNKLLNKIIPNNKELIEFYDPKSDLIIDKFSKPYTLTFREIAHLLNDYNISNRNKKWNYLSIKRIFRNFNDLDKNLKLMNI